MREVQAADRGSGRHGEVFCQLDAGAFGAEEGEERRFFGVVRRGGGIRIGGGTARSFYVGFESEGSDAPWLCIVPRDSQEGGAYLKTLHTWFVKPTPDGRIQISGVEPGDYELAVNLYRDRGSQRRGKPCRSPTRLPLLPAHPVGSAGRWPRDWRAKAAGS